MTSISRVDGTPDLGVLGPAGSSLGGRGVRAAGAGSGGGVSPVSTEGDFNVQM